jgi:hypothetical protein
MSYKIQFRRDITANWVTKNPILASGEIGVDVTLQQFKIGDGTSRWTSLAYYSPAGGTTNVTVDAKGADSEWILRQIVAGSVDSDQLQTALTTIVDNALANQIVDSDWVIRQIPTVFTTEVDSDWVIRTIKRLDVDSDWILARVANLKSSVDSDILLKSQVTNTFYVNTGANTLQNAIDKISTSTAKHLILHPGSLTGGATFNNSTTLTVSGPVAPSASPAVEILGKVTITGSNATRVRFAHVQFDSEFEIAGTQGRHTFRGVTFERAMRFSGSTSNFVTFEDCAFNGGFIVPNTFAGLIFLVRCSFNNIAPTLGQASPQQVIMSQCSGLPAFPVNATLSGQNALNNGFVRDRVGELFIGNTRVNTNNDSDWTIRAMTVQNRTFENTLAQKFTTFATPASNTITINHNTTGPRANLSYVTGLTGNLTINHTNIVLAQNEAFSHTVMVLQGSTPRTIAAFQIGGVSLTLRRLGAVTLVSDANNVNCYNFTVFRVGAGTTASDYICLVTGTSYS